MGYEEAWLKYHKVYKIDWKDFLTGIYYKEENAVIKSAAEELVFAIKKLYGLCLPVVKGTNDEGIQLKIDKNESLGEEGYHILTERKSIVIKAGGPAGILYGTFALIRKIQREIPIDAMEERKVPDNPLRMLNHWDNMDGTIERGYAGNSFFFQENSILVNDRTKDYARLLASVGINGAVINNVNVRDAATKLITGEYLKKLRKLQEIFSAYNIKLFLSLNFAAPMELGGLTRSDPLAEDVRTWWKEKLKEVYEKLPALGGFLIKADSEGRPGPFTYGRTHADGANLLAEIIEPYGGLIIWRCFVYNCSQDWRDKKTDRARAGYDNFKPLDGDFLPNVILQIKNGPMDFQVREPVSPLFGSMKQTNQMLEVQIAQEYTGQQKHVCYLIPMFKEVLNFKTCCGKDNDRVSDIISGKTYGNRNCGIAAVANTGNDDNWTGHDLAAANLYGFGRMSFDTGLTSEEIAIEWADLTLGKDIRIREAVSKILSMSWPAYEKYTSPLGIGWMVNPGHHFGPNVDGYEYDRWGTYHRADHKGLGVDRSKKGTGYALQYQESNAAVYESITDCPEELLLFFHYVEYTHRLSTGKTLIQHIYDSHFEGVEDVKVMIKSWQSLVSIIDGVIFKRVLDRLLFQYEHAKEWRDVVCSYFYRKSGIADEKNREIY